MGLEGHALGVAFIEGSGKPIVLRSIHGQKIYIVSFDEFFQGRHEGVGG